MAERFADQQFEDALERIVEQSGVLGVSAAAIQRDRKWVATVGFRTPLKRDRMDCGARLPIFSITKTLMAVTALRLQEFHPCSVIEVTCKNSRRMGQPPAGSGWVLEKS